ncbi:unnamed protein product [Microthlaspi erraticum]|uniref:MBD domain-containing protein n=1 Tax=Microthlaspi erraticum TaxID=1685480 RepID=A0A6D2IWG6_9BRAS|nr:unnamed protein product [Microthlaspi erraticum]
MQTRSSSSAPADLVPLTPFPAGNRREVHLQMVDPTTFRGTISPGWTIVTRPRSSSASNNVIVDTYFIEPGTGREFPSIESVQRHLIGEEDDKRLIRTGTSSYERSRSKQDHRTMEYASKGFRLPKGWSVEGIPRKHSSQIDKYYVERKTGKRFRSLVSAERYLNDTKQRADQELMRLQQHRGVSKDFSLPDGWIVEEKPRRNSSHIDRSYIEPGTGKKLRSLAEVERYLKAGGNGSVEQISLAMNMNDTRFQSKVIDPTPPKKVKWVLAGPGGNMFSAHVNGLDVSSSVKQTWTEAFVSLIRDLS